MPNAFSVGPDGELYIPVMGANEIWRVDIAGGAPVVARGLGVPNSVKFDQAGMIVSTQVDSGQVLRIDPRSGAQTVLADIGAGLDNCAFVGDRLFVSHMTGSIHEIMSPGRTCRVIEGGLQRPMGIAAAADGTIYVGDGSFAQALPPGGAMEAQGMLFTPGYRGFIRGVAAGQEAGEWIVTTANGGIHRYWPGRQASLELANGFDRLMDVATSVNGAVVFTEWGAGRVHMTNKGGTRLLAAGLDRPVGIAVADGNDIYVAESGAGRVVVLRGSGSETIIDGLDRPEGIAVHAGKLFVLDCGARVLLECDLDGKQAVTLGSGLPVTAPDGAARSYLGAVGVLAGPMVSCSGIAVTANGSILIAADVEGSILCLRQSDL